MIYAIIAAILAVIDQSTKSKVDDDKSITKVYNHGLPFGFLKERPVWVKLIHLTVVLGVFFKWLYLLFQKGRTAEKIGYTFLLGGGVSNLYDRWNRGHVVDYIKVGKVYYNLADFFVFAGAAVLGICTLLRFCGKIFRRVFIRFRV